jgi:RNA polymerase sigma factor (sigma-70 family)
MLLSLFLRFNKRWYKNWPEGEPLTDEHILSLYRSQQDPDLVGLLFDRYTHLVFGVCMKYLKDREEAKDAVMEIFEKLMDDLRVNEVRFFKTWLHAVARNHCLMKLRKHTGEEWKKEQYEKINHAGIMEFFQEMHLTIEDERERIIEKLQDALLQLNQEQQVCIRMMYFENRSYKEVSMITGFTLNQVKSYIQNGKRNLKNIMERSL